MLLDSLSVPSDGTDYGGASNSGYNTRQYESSFVNQIQQSLQLSLLR